MTTLEKREKKKTWKRGPKKEKRQITVRLDQQLMDQAEQIMKVTKTDMLERGLILAMKEEESELPLITSQVRFLVANATKVEQEELRDFMTYLRADEVREPTDTDRALRCLIRDYLKTLHPLRKHVMDLYSRYGRSQEDIEKMTGIARFGRSPVVVSSRQEGDDPDNRGGAVDESRAGTRLPESGTQPLEKAGLLRSPDPQASNFS